MSLGERALRLDGPTQTHSWAVVPLYEAELRFKIAHGFDALLLAFGRAGVKDRIDLGRRPAVGD